MYCMAYNTEEKAFKILTKANITYTQLEFHHSHHHSLKFHHRQSRYQHISLCHGIQTRWSDQHKLKTKKDIISTYSATQINKQVLKL